MGDTIWVDVPGLEDRRQDASIMLQLSDQLDALSAKLGVAKLSGFHDYSEAEAMYADELDEEAADAEEMPAAAGTWFDPAPALSAVRALRTHLQAHPEDLGLKPDRSRNHWPDMLMQDLEHAQAMLEQAVTRGQKFRFLIVP